MKKLLASLGLLFLAQLAPAQQGHKFTVEGDKFLLDGKPYVIHSGELHYPRVPRIYWRDRIVKMRAMGLNTISTYAFWNLHEPKSGKFDFSGDLDLAAFIKIAKEEGLWVILRPGPYICGEWDFGGFPAWLLKESDIKVRTSDPRFVAAASRYLQKVGEQTAGLLSEKGGPIILVQLENEYGSFGSDSAYLNAIKKAYEDAGFGGHLYTADSVWGRPNTQKELAVSTFPDVPIAVNFGQTKDPGVPFAELTKFRPDSPRMCGEYWVGWFDHVGTPHATKDLAEAKDGVAWMLKNGASFNLYMFHGGTNFGFMNGANWDHGLYLPDTTSYDYDAPLDEAGRPTAKFFAYRDLLQSYLPKDEKLPPLPSPVKTIKIPPVFFTESAPLSQLLHHPVLAETPRSMEDLDQAYGFIFYRHKVAAPFKGILEISDVHDYAMLWQNGRALGTLDRRLKQRALDVTLAAGQPLDILVENMGRIDFSTELMGERKGITKSVTSEAGELREWEIYPLPMTDLSGLQFGKKPIKGPAFYRAVFSLSSEGDTFLDVGGWGKGVVFVNGKNLGRYWNIGPQHTLYCPASWLRQGKNELIILDLFDEASAKRSVRGLTTI